MVGFRPVRLTLNCFPGSLAVTAAFLRSAAAGMSSCRQASFGPQWFARLPCIVFFAAACVALSLICPLGWQMPGPDPSRGLLHHPRLARTCCMFITFRPSSLPKQRSAGGTQPYCHTKHCFHLAAPPWRTFCRTSPWTCRRLCSRPGCSGPLAPRTRATSRPSHRTLRSLSSGPG